MPLEEKWVCLPLWALALIQLWSVYSLLFYEDADALCTVLLIIALQQIDLLSSRLILVLHVLIYMWYGWVIKPVGQRIMGGSVVCQFWDREFNRN